MTEERSRMKNSCPYCQSERLVKNGSVFGVPKWKCKNCGRQTSLKPPRGQSVRKKEIAVLLYSLGVSPSTISKTFGVTPPAVLDWVKAHGITRATHLREKLGSEIRIVSPEQVAEMITGQKGKPHSGWLLVAIEGASSVGNAAIAVCAGAKVVS
jgi:transposase-like protein